VDYLVILNYPITSTVGSIPWRVWRIGNWSRNI